MRVDQTSRGPRRAAQPAPAALLTSLALGVLLSGCAVTPTEAPAPAEGPDTPQTQAERSPEPAPVPVAEASPGTPYSSQDMYRILVAEFAGRRGDLPLALENYLAVARETRNAEVAERATRIAVFARDEKAGLEAATLWSELAADSVEARQVLSALLIRAGRLDEAVTQLSALLQHWDASAGRGISLVTDMLSREKDRDAVLEVMERLMAERGDDPDALLAYAQLAARMGDLDRSLTLLERLLALEPGNDKGLVFKARVLQRQGKTAGAIEALDQALEKNPEEQGVRMAFARLLVDAKRYEEAREQFERLARELPENADVRYALGLLLLQTNRPGEAKQHFEQLIALRQRRPAAYFYLAQIAETEQKFEEAIAAYRKVDGGDHYLNAQIRTAVLYAETGDVERARAHLHGLRRGSVQDTVRIYRAEAEILVRAERLEDAMKVYDAALDERPENSDLLYARAMLAEKLGKIDQLERDLRDILSREPNNADALNALGYTLADRTDRYEEALGYIERALSAKPDDFYILDSMGWVLYRLGRYQESIKYLRRALEQNDDPEIAAHLGEVLWVMGEQQEAREVWNSALESTPDDKRLLEVIKRFSP